MTSRSGALLWERPFVSPNFTNSNTPIVAGDLLIVSSNGPPTSAYRVSKKGTQWVIETAWENADVPMRLSDAVVAGDALFGISTRNSGQYFAVDVKTGKTLWTSEGRQAAHAAIARSGDLLFSMEEDGELVVARNSRTGVRTVAPVQSVGSRDVGAAVLFRQSSLRQGSLDADALDAQLIL